MWKTEEKFLLHFFSCYETSNKNKSMKPLILPAVFSQRVWRGTYTVLEDILCFPFV